MRHQPRSTLFPYTTLFRSVGTSWSLIGDGSGCVRPVASNDLVGSGGAPLDPKLLPLQEAGGPTPTQPDRKSTRLNSSHGYISYAVFCLKKKKKAYIHQCRS